MYLRVIWQASTTYTTIVDGQMWFETSSAFNNLVIVNAIGIADTNRLNQQTRYYYSIHTSS